MVVSKTARGFGIFRGVAGEGRGRGGVVCLKFENPKDRKKLEKMKNRLFRSIEETPVI